jgi:hypothetical protein
MFITLSKNPLYNLFQRYKRINIFNAFFLLIIFLNHQIMFPKILSYDNLNFFYMITIKVEIPNLEMLGSF